MTFSLGTATARPGEITYGEYDLIEHPISGQDRLPVIIAQGKTDGPTFWITAGIHGPEHTGLQVIHQLITPEMVHILRGTIVAIPALSPTGLQMANREPYYHDGGRGQPGPHPRAHGRTRRRANARPEHRARVGSRIAQRHALGRDAARREGTDHGHHGREPPASPAGAAQWHEYSKRASSIISSSRAIWSE